MPRQEAEHATTEIDEVAPGILRMQLPLSMPGLGHVNCYALEDERGFALVDPGMPGPQPWKALEDRFARAGFKLRDVHTVVVTHSHIDHFGASGRLREKAGARVVTSRTFRTWWDPTDVGERELEAADGSTDIEVPPDPRRPWDQPTPWGGRHPRPPRRVRIRYRVLRPMMKQWFATPSPSVRLADAEVIHFGRRDWVAVHTPGHTPDHLCLYDPAGGVLLSGDHVLPTITPHISGVDAGPDPLTAFFASLEKVGELDGVGTVLPAHGHPFDDLRGRVKDIERHHEDRLARLREANEELGSANVEQLSQRLFRERSWGPMAESETYAHLEHLRLSGRATREERGGLLFYSAV
jgi:glyoxylase-like metal-dependent hydrolase (beta-lactamase superfamily II)